MNGSARTSAALIKELVRTTGAQDAPSAIRIHARQLLDLYQAQFGQPTIPLSVDVLASLRGIRRSDELPHHSEDAELAPDGQGGVTMRVNPDQPVTRQRFSVAHEISHTFFPDYKLKEWCRTDARYRDRSNPDEYLEMLCDIGAAELLFPDPWFSDSVRAAQGASGIATLAQTYCASREATLRRIAENSNEPLAAVYFSWKLKPTQRRKLGDPNQGLLFGETAAEQIREALRLRIDYAIASPSFQASGCYLPKDKSVPNDGPIYRAAVTGEPVDGDYELDFGDRLRPYRIAAVPFWTAEDGLGAQGENAVAALLRPL